jgi:hypothetical protein
MQVISRKEAKAAGMTRYYTGVPCIHGHDAERHTGNNACVMCQRKTDFIYKKKKYAEDENFRKKKISRGSRRQKVRYSTDELFRAYKREHCRQYYLRNEDAFHAQSKEWARQHPDETRRIKREWAAKDYAANPEKYKTRAAESRKANLAAARKKGREWQKANPGVVNYHNTCRRALKMKAMPAWADKEKIKQIYLEAKRLGLVVDHIIPLKSKYVCGLHVENNLQLITATENARKGNKFEGGHCFAFA